MKLNAVRAWKDEAYRLNLSEKERALLPESPVGELELTDMDLEAVQGGCGDGCGCGGGNLIGVQISSVICSVAGCSLAVLVSTVSCKP